MNNFAISFYKKFKVFLEMIKFEHSIFALPFAYLGLILAEGGWPNGKLFLWVTVAMVSFRSMAMGANRIIDIKIDGANPRTQARALPAGRISMRLVWVVTLFFMILFLFVTYLLGPLCFKLSILPMALAWLYPYLKRFTWSCHFVLGMILGIAPYGAWIASRQEFSWTPAFLMIGIVCWVSGFDIIYALQDLEFDRQTGLHSFASRFGRDKSIRVTRILHVFTLICWGVVGNLASLSWIYWLGLLCVGFFLIREHWLIARYDLEKIQEAFFVMNAIVSVAIFFAVLFDLLLRSPSSS